jgi:phosphoribosylaminoimidazolecarboxamide formyltransferase / IMP cyclohydrolase
MASSHTAITGTATDHVAVRRVLLSVSDKTDIVDLARTLVEHKAELLSTGGTAKKLRDAGLTVTDVSDVTGFPEILNGRVKTLHPAVHGALLAVRGNDAHSAELKAHKFTPIDMVVANLYPFEKTIENTDDFDTCIENIDIGGPTMIRAAAKNNRAVCVVTDPQQYADIKATLKQTNGHTTFALRKRMAAAAFQLTACYDAAISAWFAKKLEQQ